MNKKFSTLATAGLLLSGALFCNVNAKDYNAAEFAKLLNKKVLTLPAGETDLVVNLTEDVVLGSGGRSGAYMVISTPNVVLTSNAGVKFTGRLVIGAENVTVKGMTFVNNPANEEANGYWTKNAITAFAAKLTVAENTFVQGARATNDNVSVSNGLVIFPQAATASYSVAGNTFTNNFVSSTGDPNYASAGVIIQEGLKLATKSGDPLAESELKGYGEDVTVEITSGLDAAAMAQANTFNECVSDYLYIGKAEEAEEDVTESLAIRTAKVAEDGYKFSQVTYSEELDNSEAVAGAVANALPNTPVKLNNITKNQLSSILETAKSELSTTPVLVETDDAFMKLNNPTIEAPANTTKEVVSVTTGSGAIKIDAAAPAETFAFGKPFILSANDKNLEALKSDGTVASYDKTAAFFWSFEKSETGAATGYAKLKNNAGDYLMSSNKVVGIKIKKVGNEWIPNDALNALALVDVDAGSSVTISGVSAYTLCEIGTSPLSASTLNKINGDSFEAMLLYNKEEMVSDPISGVLKAVELNSKGEAVMLTTNATSYKLQNAKGNIIVIRLDKKYSVGQGTYGYHVTEMSPKDLYLALAGDNKDSYVADFSVNAWDNFVAGVTKEVAGLSAKKGSLVYNLGALLVGTDEEPTLAAELDKGVLKNITIKLEQFDLINYKKFFSEPAFYELTVVNKNKKYENYGKVLGLTVNNDAFGGKAALVKAEEALLHQPETQWAASFSGNNLIFTNRENPNVSYTPIALNSIYNTKETAVFAIKGDTIAFKAVTEFDPADGYARLDADKLRDQLYYVGIQSSVWDGIAYTVENHKENHQIGLDIDKNAATEWHLAADRFIKKNTLGEDEVNRPDTIKIGSTLNYFKADGTPTSTDKDGKKTVFLKVLSYSLMNQANNEYLRYNATAGVTRYTTGLDDNKGNVVTAKDFEPNFFALKAVGKNADDKVLYNLVKVADRDAKNVEGSFDWNYKVYGGGSREKGILNRTDMYNQIENDLFVVEEKDAPEYVKLNQGDTIKIYRAETESDVLYQKGEFLGMGNAIEFNKINPALYVDTVYYNRDANNRWEYLLGINVTRIDTTYKCNVPSHGIHQADTTYGAFLVNYADSAIVEDTRDIHTNKYVYEGDMRYAKLGFEEGFRTNDTLYVARADGKFDKIEVGAPSRQLVKFAFRVMDHDANTFIIETGFKYPEDSNMADWYNDYYKTGYLRWINGNVVVTPNMEDAEVFKLKADDRNPVANEDLTASSVAVIAGEGQITVNGAAGKVVTITNVLGQTIANSVISSDNATIAAPAGIVIVSVEGEAAVKAIVK